MAKGWMNRTTQRHEWGASMNRNDMTGRNMNHQGQGWTDRHKGEEWNEGKT